MRKIFVTMVLLLSFNISFADVEDTSIIDELNKNTQDTIEEMNDDFSLKSFESCQDFEDVMGNYIKTYWENNVSKYGYYDGPIFVEDFIGDLSEESDMDFSSVSKSNTSNEVAGIDSGGSDDYSETNVQVKGVDESDIVKTDGEYIYYYNDENKYVYIVEAGTLETIKKIKIPNNFYSPVLYISDNRLVIVSAGYSNVDYSGYRYNRNTKTYVIVYDTSDINNLELSKLYLVDGSLSKSRLIGDHLYVISNTYFDIPYYNFTENEDIDIDVSNMIPKSIELTRSSNDSNLEVGGKKLPYDLKAGNVASCNEIEYVLPDEETLQEYDFSPSYNIISTINIQDTSVEVTKNVIAGSNSEIYMSLDNLYLTSHLYRNNDFECSGGRYCMIPWYPRGQNTLIHQIDVDKNNLEYKNSAIVPGNPLNQYSMDQYDDKFRIITQSNYPELATNLYILDTTNLELHGMLDSIEPGEEFKSSRFIGEKLFLVTFERTDPLFVIDMSDGQNPKILGELKIPGYSTYLHPYDENHLIGLGYDTRENNWGGTVNDGVKIDLYEINYDKKCGDDNLTEEEEEKCDSGDYKGIIVKQKYTKTFGENGSYSEALNNPRMFIWKSSENKLFLPMQLYTNAEDDMYNRIDFYQGLFTISIDKDKGITTESKLTHIDTSSLEKQREEECAKYSDVGEEKCVKLIGGGEYCEATKYNYVPEYCYADSPIGQYLASKSWEYSQSFIKRALWIGDGTYAISNKQISVNEGGDYDYMEFED